MKIFIQKVIRFLLPSLTMTRKESILAIKSLQDKLNKSREGEKEWRERCLSAELALRILPEKMSEVIDSHDAKHGTHINRFGHW